MRLYLLSSDKYKLIDLYGIDPEYSVKLLSQFKFLNSHTGISLDNVIKKETANSILSQQFDILKGKNKSIEKIKKFIKDLPNNSYFIISNVEFAPIKLFIYRSCILYANEGKNPVQGFCYMIKQIRTQEDIYDTYGYGYLDNQTITIGESDKTKRICRFCGKSQPFVSYVKKAHAISESVGNKQLVCNEECDICNGEFGDHEQNFANYMRIINLLSSQKEWVGKGDIDGQTYDIEITYDENNKQTIKIINIFDNPNKILAKKEKYLVHLYEEKTPIILSKVYKSLIKYTLSVLPNEYLKNFADTISWIKSNEKSQTELPLVYRAVRTPINHPFLICHVRKATDQKYPYCICELHCYSMIFIYIIPFSNQDNTNNLKDIAEDKIAELYPHIKIVKENFNTDDKYSISTDLQLNT